MLGVLRTAGIPSRYVCGYIESDPIKPPEGTARLIGSLATHAWVEALTPGMRCSRLIQQTINGVASGTSRWLMAAIRWTPLHCVAPSRALEIRR